MKFLFDLFPVLLFFTSFKWAESHTAIAQGWVNHYLSGLISGGAITLDQAPILLATALTIIASVLQIGSLFLRRKKVDAMLWISFIVIALFGSATIYFHNDTFIKWKPTVIYWCYAGAFLLGQFVFKKNILKTVMGSQITLPESVWFKLGLAWIIYFTLMGFANLYVAFNFPTSTWVSYKLYSNGSIVLFILAQSFYLSKYMEEPHDKPV